MQHMGIKWQSLCNSPPVLNKYISNSLSLHHAGKALTSKICFYFTISVLKNEKYCLKCRFSRCTEDKLAVYSVITVAYVAYV